MLFYMFYEYGLISRMGLIYILTFSWLDGILLFRGKFALFLLLATS